jgi:PKHD-type hydroxylase
MIYPYLFVTISGAITKQNCNKILKHIKSLNIKPQKALLRNEANKPRKVAHLKIRDTENLVFATKWVYDLINPIINNINKQYWNFQYDWNESIQYLHYKKGGHFTWHADQGLHPYDSKTMNSHINYDGKIRKLSASIQLSDPKNYEGGTLEIESPWTDNCTKHKIIKLNKPEHLKQGTVIIFPSYVNHRVIPVTKGKRDVLVCWFLGDRYK